MRCLPLLLCASLAAPIGAQRAYHHPVPNCNLAERRTDAGVTLRRYQIHAIRAGLAISGAIALRKVFKAPEWVSSVVPMGVSFTLHVVGAARHQYPVDLRDWAFDAFVVAAPALYQVGKSGGTWQSMTLAGTTYATGYLAGACFASP